MTDQSDNGLIKLWPTSLMQRQLPGCEKPNELLQQLIEKMDADTDNLTTRYRDADFLHGSHPATKWLLQCINKTVVDYLHAHHQRYQSEWQVQSWPNINRFGDYHDLHNHPHSYLSGTYYVSIPVASDNLPGRDDRRPGAISFYDPRPQANMNAVAGDPQIEAEYTVQPTDGMLLLWPSFLHHFVHPNLSQQPRISISFNVVLKWSDALLPTQS
ncbi:MAG: TIGR02466 family protein [Pseudomonadota bacterium]